MLSRISNNAVPFRQWIEVQTGCDANSIKGINLNPTTISAPHTIKPSDDKDYCTITDGSEKDIGYAKSSVGNLVKQFNEAENPPKHIVIDKPVTI